jgi:hypothetical protein
MFTDSPVCKQIVSLRSCYLSHAPYMIVCDARGAPYSEGIMLHTTNVLLHVLAAICAESQPAD